MKSTSIAKKLCLTWALLSASTLTLVSCTDDETPEPEPQPSSCEVSYHSQYDSVVTGAPVGAAVVSNNGMTFTRQFANGTVWVNCADGSYGIEL